MNDSYGVFAGRFYPPNKGHINAILSAARCCAHLFVVVCDNKNNDQLESELASIDVMPASLRYKWLCQQLSDYSFISVLYLDETDIPSYPAGMDLWASRLIDTVMNTSIYRNNPLPLEFYGGKSAYINDLTRYGRVNVYDIDASWYPLKSDVIVRNPIKYWNYLVDESKGFFATKVLITGIRNTGKSVLTRQLALAYNTSYSINALEEYMDDNGIYSYALLSQEDLIDISAKQRLLNKETLDKANRVCFFDGDSILTQYYCEQTTNTNLLAIEQLNNIKDFDLVIMLKPNDLFDNYRQIEHNYLKALYSQRGFRIIEIDGIYQDKFNEITTIIDAQLGYNR